MGHPGHADESHQKLQHGAFFLLGGQKPGHELCSNAVHVQITRENCLHCSYDTLTIAAISLIVLRRSSCTSHRIVFTFLGVELVEGRRDLSSSSSDVLKGRHFSSDAEVIAAAGTWLDGQPSGFFFAKLDFGRRSLCPSW